MRRIGAKDYKEIAKAIEDMLKGQFAHLERIRAFEDDIKFNTNIPLENHEAEIKLSIKIRESSKP